MKRLILFASLVSTIFVLLCGAAILLGKSQPVSIPPSLEFCDGMPCYMGIVLNRTTGDEAKRIFSNTPGYTLSAYHDGADVSVGYFQHVVIFSNNGPGFEIDLTDADPTIADNVLSVGMALNVLGTPCAIYSLPASAVYPNRYLVVLHYPDRVIYVITNQWHVEPKSPVGEVDLGPYDRQTYMEQKLCRSLKVTSLQYTWQGFRQYLPK